MKLRSLIFLNLFSIIRFSQTGPVGVGTNNGTSSLDLWLRGDAGVEVTAGIPAVHLDNVSIWRDQSGYGHHALQTTAAFQPNFASAGMGGRPTLSFNTTNTEFFTTSLTFGQDVTFLVEQRRENNRELKINLAELSSGMYLIQTKTARDKVFKL